CGCEATACGRSGRAQSRLVDPPEAPLLSLERARVFEQEHLGRRRSDPQRPFHRKGLVLLLRIGGLFPEEIAPQVLQAAGRGLAEPLAELRAAATEDVLKGLKVAAGGLLDRRES